MSTESFLENTLRTPRAARRLARACGGVLPRARTTAVIVALMSIVASAGAQTSTPDTTARIAVRVVSDSVAVEAAVVRAGRVGGLTDAGGQVELRVPAGSHVIVASKPGFRPDSAFVTVHAGADTAITMSLEEAVTTVEAVIVSATRGERRIEDVPLRIEVIDEEEIAEKAAMTPGDIAMMLNETSGLRVQATSPSLGGASVRIQGLSGRYSLLLADGLPLYGGQAGGVGLLQIPPLDLGRVEVIKGTASALYGSQALGGVVNLLSRRPEERAAHTALVNQTTRGGTDGVAFLTGPISDAWSFTLLAGAHRQAQRDLDRDGWTDLPGYDRVVARPRLHFSDGAGRTAFLTAGFTAEDRDGGTLPGRTAPDGRPFPEGLTTRRADAGGLARWVVGPEAAVLRGAILTLRGSAMEQRHEHAIGAVRERGGHRTAFGEVALALPRGRTTFVGGAAIQHDAYRAEDVAGFDYRYTVPAVFAQADLDAATWLSLSTSARLDAHSEYGATVNPRLSLLFRLPHDGPLRDWASRLSVGSGASAPTPFTETTEATGLTPLLPLAGLVAERATTGSLDFGGPLRTALGALELDATAFTSRVRHPIQVADAPGTTADGARRIQLVNAPEPTRTWGAELLARFVRELGETADDGEDAPTLRLTGSYTHLRSIECTPVAAPPACVRREVPLTPRHAAGVVAAIEREGRSRVGLEVYYTGRQALDENPYRTHSRPYVVLGLLGERAIETAAGTARVFLNLENLTNVRQTRHDPLVLPARGQGGRWTTDAWTELTGFTANAGVRFAF